MRIGMMKRLQITYAFWKALGAKNRNTVMAVVHECGFVDLTAGQLSDEYAKTMQSEIKSAGYDHDA